MGKDRFKAGEAVLLFKDGEFHSKVTLASSDSSSYPLTAEELTFMRDGRYHRDQDPTEESGWRLRKAPKLESITNL